MRTCRWMVGLFLLLGLATGAPAQQQLPASSFLTGVRPQDVVSKKIDTTGLVAAPTPSVVRQNNIFGTLANLLGKFTLPIFPLFRSQNQSPLPVLPGQYQDAFAPLPPTTTLPPPSPNPFQPLLPITPK